jgi:hypothetical protein
MEIDRARQLIREHSPIAADEIELLGAGIPFLLAVRRLQDALYDIELNA